MSLMLYRLSVLSLVALPPIWAVLKVESVPGRLIVLVFWFLLGLITNGLAGGAGK